jgi:hypothetical protein
MDMNIQEAEPITREDKLAMKQTKPRADMLYEVFPRHIADALKAGRKVEPETHEMVTVSYVLWYGMVCYSNLKLPAIAHTFRD